jgi:hypothetical protein
LQFGWVECAVEDEQAGELPVPVFAIDIALLSDDPWGIEASGGESGGAVGGESLLLKEAGTVGAVDCRDQKRLLALLNLPDAGEGIAEPEGVGIGHADEQ